VAALLVATGGLLFSFAGAAVLGWLVLRLGGRDGPVLDALLASWPDSEARRRGILAFVLTLALAATGLALRPEGFQALLQLPGQYVAQAAGAAGPLAGLAAPLVTYAPVSAVFGLVGLVVAWRRGRAFGRLLAVWLVVGAALAYLAGPATFPDLLLPLSLAAGVGLGALARSLAESFRWREEGLMTAILLVVAGYLLLTGFRAVTMAATTQDEVARMQLPLGLLVVGLLVLVYWFLWGGGTTLRVLGLAWLVVGSLLAWSGGTALNYRSQVALVEPLRPVYLSPDGARLVADLEAAAQARKGYPEGLTVRADPSLEGLLGWALRRQGQLRWASAKDAIEEEAVIVPGAASVDTNAPSGSGEQPSFGPGAYMGRPYRVAGSFGPPFLTAEGFDVWLALRWLLLREPARDSTLGGSVRLDPVSLYLRVDEGVTE
jgi:hypothetical protein